MREHLVVGVRLHQVAERRQKLKPDGRGVGAADGEEEGHADQVEDGDPLVILRQQPRLDAVVGVEVVDRGEAAAPLVRALDSRLRIAAHICGLP